MLPVIWRPQAIENLVEIIGYISERNFQAANDLHNEIEHVVSNIPQHPYLYKIGRVAGTREIVVHPNYIVIYQVTESAIEVVSILHSRQQYP
jgi:toxin ParE1/3/4